MSAAYTPVFTQAAQAHNMRSYIVSFFYFFVNAQRNVTSGIYYYTTIEFDFAKRDSRLAAYGGVVLTLSFGGNPQNDNSPKSR